MQAELSLSLPQRLAAAPARRWLLALSPSLALAGLLLVKGVAGSWAMPTFSYMVLVLTFFHINLGVVRSHGNASVFKRFRRRLLLVPLVTLALLQSSASLLAIGVVLAVQWDAYHTAMQTFGLARLFNAGQGAAMRRLDLVSALSLEYIPNIWLLTALPLPALAKSLASDMGWQATSFQLSLIRELCPLLQMVMVSYMLGLLALSMLAYLRAWQQGRPLPLKKLILFASTALCGFYAMRAGNLLEYALLGNLYHAAQYLILLPISERAAPSLLTPYLSHPLAYFALAALVLAVVRTLTQDNASLASLWLTLSLLHFWSDGFIWSAREHAIICKTAAKDAL